MLGLGNTGATSAPKTPGSGPPEPRIKSAENPQSRTVVSRMSGRLWGLRLGTSEWTVGRRSRK